LSTFLIKTLKEQLTPIIKKKYLYKQFYTFKKQQTHQHLATLGDILSQLQSYLLNSIKIVPLKKPLS